MKPSRALPWAAAVAALAAALWRLLPSPPPRDFDVAAAGRLPVLEGGRQKPLDSVARNALLAIHGRQHLSDGARRLDATEWLLDVMFRTDVADAQPLFVIDDPDVLGLLGLPQGPGRYRSVRDLTPHLETLQRQAETAQRVEPAARSRFERAVVVLVERIRLYIRLRSTMQAGKRPLALELAQPAARGAAERRETLAARAAFRAFPPVAGGGSTWRSTGEALAAAAAGERDPALAAWALLSAAWSAQQAGRFGEAVKELERITAARAPGAARHARLEVAFNRSQPFESGMAIYVVAFLVACASWAFRPALLRPTALALAAAGLLVHTAGIAARVVLQGRPPVTNLYSSAVFVGWVAVLLAVVLERVHRKGFGAAAAAAAGFASLLVAHHLTGSGDTLEMMRAVLDSNFWLATHVVAITMGYGATFVAGALAIGATVRRHAVTRPDPDTTRALSSGVYGVVCFALFFSFLGTVLGGIWADQSWGRFWGWDPKENGALVIVLWNAIILHARLGGYVRERGIAAMAIVGNAITSLSWFGVNMLGVGLHSYGFMDRAFPALAAFVGSQLVLAAIALAPPLRRAVAAERADAPAGEAARGPLPRPAPAARAPAAARLTARS